MQPCTETCATTNTVRLRELAVKADSRRKIPCHTRELNWLQQCVKSGAESTELHPNYQTEVILGNRGKKGKGKKKKKKNGGGGGGGEEKEEKRRERLKKRSQDLKKKSKKSSKCYAKQQQNQYLTTNSFEVCAFQQHTAYIEQDNGRAFCIPSPYNVEGFVPGKHQSKT